MERSRESIAYLRNGDKRNYKRKLKVKVKVSTLDIAPLRGTPPQKRSCTDHTVLPANFTVPASTGTGIST